MALTYYGLLDSVRFGEAAARDEQRRLLASGVLMLDILVGRQTPVLQQGQVYDSALFLDAVEAGGDDAAAILRLIRRDVIRMKIFDAADLLRQPTDEERFTLRNAFVSRLTAPTPFVWSAWSDLNDPECREVLRSVLSGESNEGLPRELNARVLALEELDAAFRESPSRERALPVPDLDLGMLVTDDVRRRRPDAPGAAVLQSELRHLEALRNEDPARYPSRTRSGWFQLLDDYASRTGRTPDHPRHRELRELVSQHYNVIVARSLAAEDAVGTAERQAASILEGSSLRAGRLAQAVMELPPSAAGGWLEWRSVPERLEDWRYLDPDARVTQLLDDRLVALEHDNAAVAYVRGLPSRLHDSIAASGGALIGAGVGGATEGDVSGLVAGLVSAAVAPLLYRLAHLDGVVDRMVARLDDVARRRARSKLLEEERIVLRVHEPEDD